MVLSDSSVYINKFLCKLCTDFKNLTHFLLWYRVDLKNISTLVTQDKIDLENKLRCLESEVTVLRNQNVIKANEYKAKEADIESSKSDKLALETKKINNSVMTDIEKQLTESNKRNLELIKAALQLKHSFNISWNTGTAKSRYWPRTCYNKYIQQ